MCETEIAAKKLVTQIMIIVYSDMKIIAQETFFKDVSSAVPWEKLKIDTNETIIDIQYKFRVVIVHSIVQIT